MATRSNRIDPNDIDWTLNGERINEGNINRPIEQLVEKINLMYDELKGETSDLEYALVHKGMWSPLSGSFPTDDVKTGDFYIVSENGFVNGKEFREGDRILALKNNASPTVFDNEWFRMDGPGVRSLDGKIGDLNLQPMMDIMVSIPYIPEPRSPLFYQHLPECEFEEVTAKCDDSTNAYIEYVVLLNEDDVGDIVFNDGQTLYNLNFPPVIQEGSTITLIAPRNTDYNASKFSFRFSFRRRDTILP